MSRFHFIWYWPFRVERTEGGDLAFVWQGYWWRWRFQPKSPEAGWFSLYRWTLSLGPLEISRLAASREGER